MYFVIAGAGEVGTHVAMTLRQEKHEVVVIERDPYKVEQLGNALDALILEGNGASIETLKQAGIEEADCFLGLTGEDEVNMVAAVVAHGFGVERTVARVNNAAYMDTSATEKFRKIGIDVAVCPELVAAEKIAQSLTAPSLMNVDVFADRVAVCEIRVDADAQGVGMKIKDLDLPAGVNFVAVNREGETYVARGDTMLHAEDRVLVAMTRQERALELEELIGRPRYVQSPAKLERIVIAGATRMGIHLARLLEKEVREVMILEVDPARHKVATETLDNTLIINGSPTDRAVLLEEDVGDADAFVGATPNEETNILSCLMVKKLGVKKTVALIEQPELRDLVESINVDLAITPRLATVGTVLRQIYKAETRDLVMTHEGDAQIIEYMVHDDAKVAGKSLKKVKFPREAVCVAIIRGDEVVLPRGNDVLLPGDRVVVYTKPDEMQRLEQLFS